MTVNKKLKNKTQWKHIHWIQISILGQTEFILDIEFLANNIKDYFYNSRDIEIFNEIPSLKRLFRDVVSQMFPIDKEFVEIAIDEPLSGFLNIHHPIRVKLIVSRNQKDEILKDFDDEIKRQFIPKQINSFIDTMMSGSSNIKVNISSASCPNVKPYSGRLIEITMFHRQV